MIKEKNVVMCCICGESLSFDEAVQIEIKPPHLTIETQTVYSHKICIDKVLHKAIPRHPDLIENE
jgi:hypothetical protein